jgi:hypothetical protein
MRIANHTPLPIQLFRNAEDGDRITAFVLCALTCHIRAGGLVVAREQRPLETDPALPYPHDAMWLNERAASVCATGFVYAAGGEAPEAEASIAVGDCVVRAVAVGPRVYCRGLAGRVVPSAPRPFRRIPMAWEQAFGGCTERPWTTHRVDGEDVMVPGHVAHFPHNPSGTGFYDSDEDAVGKPLPLLEDPDDRIGSASDWPRPRCFAPYPIEGAMRADLVLRGGTEVLRDDLVRLATRAMPALTFDALDAGTPIEIRGMRADGAALTFSMPTAPMSVTASVGGDRSAVDARLDSADIDVEAGLVRFVFRAVFAYDLVRRERRAIAVEPAGLLAAS